MIHPRSRPPARPGLAGWRRAIAGVALIACETAEPPDPAESPAAQAGPDSEVPVASALTLDAGDSAGDRFAWDLGDGRRVDGSTAEVSWSTPGNYTVVLIAEGAGGARSTDARVVSVYEPAVAPTPLTTGTIAETADGVWTVEPDADQVLLVAKDGTIRRIATCDRPVTVTASEVPGEALVACAEGAILAYQADGSVREVATRLGEVGGAIQAGGAVWWSAPGVGEVVADDGRITRVAAPDPRALAWVGGAVWAPSFRAAPDSDGVVLHPSDGRPPIALARELGPDSDTGSRGVFNLADALAISPSGSRLYLGGLVANDAAGLARDGTTLTPETTVRAALRVVDLDAGAEIGSKFPDNQDRISAVALSPRGTWLWAASPGTHKVVRYDAFTLDIAGSISDAGAGIDGLRVSADGATLWVHASLDRTLSAWDLTDPARPTLRSTWSTVDVEPLDAQVLDGKRLFHESGDPRMSKDGYVSCASCHPDGDHDGRVWDFTQRGEGLRNTISLLGHAGVAMGPVHWTANFDEIHDFENDIRNGQGGAGLLTDDQFAATEDPLGAPKAGLSDDLDALAAYVTSLDRPRPSPWPVSDPASELAFFVSLGCDDCHLGPAYTDSGGARHDVGTFGPGSGSRRGGALDGLDTPTLLGVWSTPPYLHDGSAETLEDAISRHVPGLSEADLVRVAAFARSL